jgi:LPS O-antigen subunit length determinant protein (WzzB/FepE family)
LYGQVATAWYTAEVVLVPADDQAMRTTNRLGALAGLAGIDLANTNVNTQAQEFISENELMPALLNRSRSGLSSWFPHGSDRADIRDAVKFFDHTVRSVDEDKKNGLITLDVTWTDPVVAAQWANLLVARANDRLRSQALSEAEANIQYLQKEISTTQVTAMQESLGQILESEMQKLLMARGNREFAFKVIDTATPPKEKARPRRVLIAIGGAIAGAMLGVLLALFRRLPKRGVAVRHSEPSLVANNGT